MVNFGGFCLFKWILWISCFSEFVNYDFLRFWRIRDLQFFTILVNFANFVIIMIFCEFMNFVFLWICEFNDLLEFLEFCIYIHITFHFNEIFHKIFKFQKRTPSRDNLRWHNKLKLYLTYRKSQSNRRIRPHYGNYFCVQYR